MTLLNRWLKGSIDESGREGDGTQAVKDELTYLAGWRCQFAGCGRDLKRHGATGGRGRFSYFAHIVAASSSGPRGDPVLSKLLASDISNFMLLCDECHREIDKVNPAKYSVEGLRKMREDSIAEVRRLLDSLQHKSAEVIAIVGNIAGQPAPFSMDDAHEAMWGAGLRSTQAKPARYFDPGGHHHGVHTPAYWGSLFQQMKSDIPALQTLLNGTRSGATRPRLAIFPLHSTSVLLLAGRILGDAAGTHLFQPHRNKVGPGTRWSWPAAGTLPTPPLDKFKVEMLRDNTEGRDEAALIVALTSDIDAPRMPDSCARDGQLLLPTLRVIGPSFDKDCMQQPEDLQLVGLAVDAAIRKLQDEWRVRKVHLFVSAPTSAVMVVGQKMQARHHADYVCHESVSGPGSAYKATIEITSTSVRELASGLAETLSLQP
ncbi:SMODS-associated and fused to various effectors domain-containing protein [Cupriavidus necator]